MGGAPQRRRRSGDPRQQRDPEGNRNAILEAARKEFDEHGFGGARVIRIAEAAGLSHQLITYHFGGKQGLYDALQEDWSHASHELLSKIEPYAELIRSYVRAAYEGREWVRSVIREELEGHTLSESRISELRGFVAQAQAHQASGEIRQDLDAGVLTLAVFAAAIAPIVLPAHTRAFTGADPGSDEFMDHYADQLAHVVAALSEAPSGTSRMPTR